MWTPAGWGANRAGAFIIMREVDSRWVKTSGQPFRRTQCSVGASKNLPGQSVHSIGAVFGHRLIMRRLSGMLLAVLLALSAAGQVKVAPLDIKQRTLKNGLKVYTVRDTTSPSVTVQVWYNVGSKNDPEGRNGFAHLFEHIMFKSTKNMKSEMMDRLTEDVGGSNNASTTDDVTNYYEIIPSNHLETLIWAEAERLSNLTVDQPNFVSERAVVEEEFRQSVLAQPYGMFNEYIQKLSYSAHPYRRTTIGTIEDLDTATLDDVINFHKTFYRPDNANLIIVGDFEQQQLDGWIDKYFGRIEKPAGPIPVISSVEPARTKEARYIKTAPNVPLPAVAITYLIPGGSNKDIAALKVAGTILSGGHSSRLYQSLVYKQQIAGDADFNVGDFVDTGLAYFSSTLATGHKPEEAEKSLLAELKRIQAVPPSEKELQKAVNGLVASTLRRTETNEGKAFAIGRAIIYRGSADAVNREIGEIQSVTAADVQRVMKKYFSDTNRVVIYYENQGDQK
jgi:zinc protease